MEHQEEKSWNMLRQRLFSLNSLLFLLASSISALTGALIASEAIKMAYYTYISIVHLEITLLVIIWLSILLTADKEGSPFFFAKLIEFSVLTIPVSIMLLSACIPYQKYTYWLTLLSWLGVAVVTTIDRAEKSGMMKFLMLLSTIWGITAGITIVGTLPFLGFSKEALHSMTTLHAILDIRYIFGIICLALILGLAFLYAIEENLPSLPKLPTLRLRVSDQSSRSILGIFIIPFLSLANILLIALSIIFDLLLKVLAVTAIYLLRVGKHTGKILWQVIVERAIGKHVLKFVGLFLCILSIVLLCRGAIYPSIIYLKSSQWATELAKLGILTLYVALMVPLVAAVYALNTERLKLAHHQIAFGLAMVLAILLVAGGFIHGISRIDSTKISGFNNVGPYTIIILCIVVGGATKLLLLDKNKE